MSYLGNPIKFTACGCTLTLGDEPIAEWECEHGNFMRSGKGRIPFDLWVGNVNDPPPPLSRIEGCSVADASGTGIVVQAPTTAINVRLSDDLLAEVDAYAEKKSLSRAETIRALLTRALHTEPAKECPKCRGWYTGPHRCQGTYPA